MELLFFLALGSIFLITCILAVWCIRLEHELKQSWIKEKDDWEVKLP